MKSTQSVSAEPHFVEGPVDGLVQAVCWPVRVLEFADFVDGKHLRVLLVDAGEQH